MSTLPAVAAAPDFAQRLRSLVVDSVHSRESKRAYSRGVDEFLKWVAATKPAAGFSKATVQAYRAQLVASGLAPSTVNLRMTAIRRLAAEAADNGLLAPEAASGIARVKGARRQGVRIGNWLTVPLAEALLHEPDTRTRKGQRDRMTAQAVFNTVKAYASALGLNNFAPHDLRRSYAKLAHKGRAPLEQIQLSLGHASIQTTERYLGVEQNFTDAPCDHLGVRPPSG